MIYLFFVIHPHSGAKTYANELLGYLKNQSEISVCVIYLGCKNHHEYTEIRENGLISIFFPRIKREAGSLKKYSARCIDILSPRLHGKENIIFHLNYGTQIYFGLEARKRYGAYIIYTQHYLPEYLYYLDFNKSLEQNHTVELDALEIEIIENSDKVICISNFSKRALNKHLGFPNEKIEVIHNGYGTVEMVSDLDKERNRERFGFRDNENLILFSGRLIGEEKGVYMLIEAFKKLLNDLPNSRLILANNGDFQDILERCTDIIGRVTLTGRLSMEQLQKLYDTVDIGVVPSNYELLGYVPIEMMLYQIPMVVSNVPGMNELIEDGVHGLKCKVTNKKNGTEGLEVDEVSLYEKMKELLTNRVLARQLSVNARNHWKNCFTANHLGKSTLGLYQEMFTPKVKVI